MADLEIKDLHVKVEDREILRGVNLEVSRNQTHALMGPNGSGKSTLANAIMGHPGYEVTAGKILFEGTDITEAEPDERARAGLFMAFQYPASIPGVSVANFLRTAINAQRGVGEGDGGGKSITLKEFRALLKDKMELLGVEPDFTKRYLNDGFSGGEKKRAEILQLAILQPKVAVLDETDSGLDIDALKTVAEGVNAMRETGLGTLIITHYQRILGYVKPDYVHVMFAGRIVREGGPELVTELEKHGYEMIREELEASGEDVGELEAEGAAA